MSEQLQSATDKITLLLWYKNPAKFFKDIYGLDPYPYQVNVLGQMADLKNRRVMIMASAGSGKTKLVACHALWLAVPLAFHLNRPVSIVIISGSEEQAKNLYNYIRSAVIDNPLLKKLVEGEIMTTGVSFRVLNGISEIKPVPNSHKQIQGLHKDVVIIDEPTLAGDFAILDATRIVVKNDSLDRILLLGTPFVPPDAKKKSDLYIQMWEDTQRYPEGEPWKRFHWTNMDCPTVTPQQMEEAKKNLPEEMFNVFWLGKPYFARTSMIPFEHIKRASMDVHTAYNPEYPVYGGLDYGWKAETVLTLTQYINGTYHVILSEGWRREEYQSLVDRIAEIYKEYKIDTLYADSEDIGDNQRLLNLGLNIIPVIFRNDKVKMQVKLKAMFHQDRIKIDETMMKLKDQLRRYDWNTHEHDDRVDSLMLSMHKNEEETVNIYWNIVKPSKPIFESDRNKYSII